MTCFILQVARYLVKCCRQSKDSLPQSTKYLQGALNQGAPKGKPVMDISTPHGITDLYERVAKGQIVQAVTKMDKLSISKRPEDAWNETSIELTQAAMAHTRYYVISENAHALYSIKMSPEVKKVLTQLFHLISIHWIMRFSGDFQIYGGLGKEELALLQLKFNQLLGDLRPIGVSLVDAFDIHDISLKSTLGAFDGQVYQRMFEAALKSPLNKTDVTPAYEKYIKPILKANL